MKLPIIRMRLLPELRCMRCGQRGYVEEKSTMCLACYNISLLRFAKLRPAELLRQIESARRLFHTEEQ